MTAPLPIFIGYDSREHTAYQVAKHSIESRASVPVLITPLYLPHLPMLRRPIARDGDRLWCPISCAPMSTEFAISRFCVPMIQREGWALFADSDILCLADIAELFALADDRYAVMVVKHKHESGCDTKMDNQAQTYYARKNWSSVILYNNSHPGHLRLKAMNRLNEWPGRDLHAFRWLQDGDIGELPAEWNHLVGVSSGAASILHYTLGTPNLPGYEDCDFADLWHREHDQISANRAVAQMQYMAA
jgi:hypothetical protein